MTQKSTLVLLRHMSPSESLQKYVIQKLNCSLFKFYKMFQFKVHKCLPIRNRGLERFLLYYLYWKNTCSTNICFFFMFIQFIFRNFFLHYFKRVWHSLYVLCFSYSDNKKWIWWQPVSSSPKIQWLSLAQTKTWGIIPNTSSTCE